MNISDRAKIILSVVFLTGSIVWFAVDSYPDEVDAFIVSLKSAVLPSENSDQPIDPLQIDSKSSVKTDSVRKAKNLKGDAGDGAVLNLEAPGGLEMLGDELLEDSLWEEGILRSRPEGVRSGRAVLDALSEIDSWSPIETGYNAARLKIFLRYPKLWVRLSALAFAMKAKAISEQEEIRLARIVTLKYRENPSQIGRFLKRYERKDPELFQRISKRLGGPSSGSTPDEPDVNEFIDLDPDDTEDGENDAS